MRVFQTLNYTLVVVVQPGGQHVWTFRKRRSVSQFKCSPLSLFLISLLTIAISSQLQSDFFMRTFIPTFFVGRYHTSCLSTDEWFFLFPTTLVAQVIVGSMGNTPPIWVHGVGTFLLLFSLPGFCTFVCGTLTGILHLYTWTTLLHHFTFWTRVFTPFSPTLFLHLQQEFTLSFWSFFLT